MTPEALRRRMAHGNVYAPEEVDAALANYFRAGNLGALRELALLWVADQVDIALEQYRRVTGSTSPGRPASGWSSRSPARREPSRSFAEPLGSPGGPGASCWASTCSAARGPRRSERRPPRGPPGAARGDGGEYHEVSGGDIAAALVDFARAESATSSSARAGGPGGGSSRAGRSSTGSSGCPGASTSTWCPRRSGPPGVGFPAACRGAGRLFHPDGG